MTKHILRINELSSYEFMSKILKNELAQSKFPHDWKCEKTYNVKMPVGISKKMLNSLASDIFAARYGGNVPGMDWPVYNMFNANHVKLMQNTKIVDELENSGIVKFVKSYTQDTNLGPQTIYFLTQEGENIITNLLYNS